MTELRSGIPEVSKIDHILDNLSGISTKINTFELGQIKDVNSELSVLTDPKLLTEKIKALEVIISEYKQSLASKNDLTPAEVDELVRRYLEKSSK